MRIIAVRLRPNEKLKRKIKEIVEEEKVKSGFIVTCVGSLQKATLRLADEDVIKIYEEKLEIVSLVGTLSPEGVHLHVSLSNKEGTTIGGHLKEAIIYTTAELIIGESDDHTFTRVMDQQTGFKELTIQ